MKAAETFPTAVPTQAASQRGAAASAKDAPASRGGEEFEAVLGEADVKAEPEAPETPKTPAEPQTMSTSAAPTQPRKDAKTTQQPAQAAERPAAPVLPDVVVPRAVEQVLETRGDAGDVLEALIVKLVEAQGEVPRSGDVDVSYDAMLGQSGVASEDLAALIGADKAVMLQALMPQQASNAEGEGVKLDALDQLRQLLNARLVDRAGDVDANGHTKADADASMQRLPTDADVQTSDEQLEIRVTHQETHLDPGTRTRAAAEAAVSGNQPRVAVKQAGDVPSDKDTRKLEIEDQPEATLEEVVELDQALGQDDVIDAQVGGERRQGQTNSEGRTVGPVTASIAGAEKSSGAPGVMTFADLATDALPHEQISTRVMSELNTARTEISTGGAVKVLELQLAPQSLGTVTIRISLKDDAISLNIEAQLADTARMIEQDRDMLSNALKQAGYMVDEIVAQQVDVRGVARSETSSSLSMQSGGGQDQGQSAFGGDSAGQSRDGMPRDGRSNQETNPGQGLRDTPADDGVDDRSGAVYV